MTNQKKFVVNIDMKWSEDIHIKAKNMAEAKKKAWNKFKKRCPKKNFEILADKID